MKVVRDTSLKASDQELYEEMKSGSVNAYNALFERHWESLYSISVHLLRDREIAKDVIQEVFLSFWENRLTSDIQNVGGYLSRSAKFASLKHIRDDHSSLHQQIDHAENLTSAEEHRLDTEELEQQIDGVIAELPERCREVFLLSREEHLTNKEIAQKLDLSQRTVETHISNALKHLKNRLPKDLLVVLLVTLIR